VRAGALSPAHYRWLRFLRDLDLDPDRLPRPVTPPSDRDFIICGTPRSGTTLAAAVLFQPPSVVTVSEPWDGLRLPPDELFRSVRAELATGVLRRGRLDVRALTEEGTVRWCRDGELPVRVHTSGDVVVGVKWPAFWRYVDLLPDTRFVVCVRAPGEVVRSCKEKRGRLIMGFDYRVAFNREMNAELRRAARTSAERRVLLYEYINSRLLGHLDRPNVYVLRYERWFGEPEQVIRELSSFLGVPLGPGYARIRARGSSTSLSRTEIRMLEQHSSAARALGYAVERSEAEVVA